MSSLKPAYGFETYGQFGIESTWGTLATPTKRVPIYTANPRPDIGRVRPQIMDGGISQPKVLAAGKRGLITVEMPLMYDMLGIVIDCFFGTSTYGSIGSTDAGSGPTWTHTWSGFKKLLNSMSWQFGLGTLAAGEMAEQYLGAKITKATIRGQSGLNPENAVVHLALEMVTKVPTDGATLTDLSSGAQAKLVQPALMSHVSALTNASGSTAERTLDFELVFDTGAKPDRFFLEGSGAVSEPHRMKRPSFTATFNEEFQSKAAMDAYLANTKTANTFTLSDGTNSFAFTFTSALTAAPEHPVTGDDFLRQKLVVEAERSSADETVALVLTNGVATTTG